MGKKPEDEYQEMLSTFKLEVPEFFNAGFDIVDRWAEQDPNKLALVAVDSQGDGTDGKTKIVFIPYVRLELIAVMTDTILFGLPPIAYVVKAQPNFIIDASAVISIGPDR